MREQKGNSESTPAINFKTLSNLRHLHQAEGTPNTRERSAASAEREKGNALCVSLLLCVCVCVCVCFVCGFVCCVNDDDEVLSGLRWLFTV